MNNEKRTFSVNGKNVGVLAYAASFFLANLESERADHAPNTESVPTRAEVVAAFASLGIYLDESEETNHSTQVADENAIRSSDAASHPAIVMIGNLFDGFDFVGPFADFDLAAGFADKLSAENVVATINPPVDYPGYRGQSLFGSQKP